MKRFGLLLLIIVLVSGCAGITETGNPIPQETSPGSTDPGDGGGPAPAPAAFTYYESEDGKIKIGYPSGWSVEQLYTADCPEGSACAVAYEIQFVSGSMDTIEKDVSFISSSDSLQDYIDENFNGVAFTPFANGNVAEAYAMLTPVAVNATHVMKKYIFRTGTTLLTLTATYRGSDTGIAAQIDTIMKIVVVK